ncbi:hypothetical protein J5N97_015324 [Dioscorea zingiberensis]|uniref:Uncharacterized protein n=1 Tax=Dioscorea zingiberensis TaxID=325984 RepID=A0A9D5CU13_9LILI|nr:hypothetical protein J5N97_015324 [Dioscorea zingiberensis]
MGQALRRAAIKGRSSRTPTPSPPVKDAEPVAPVRRQETAAPAGGGGSDAESLSRPSDDYGMLEERDPGYDAMLQKMVGRISTKPGGKPEMGEAFIVEKYNRPMPKLRTSKAEADGQKPIPAGTLTAAQVQEIILLYQGKSIEHQGQMQVHEIAQKFRIDATHVQRIVQFISLPSENQQQK